LIFFSTALYGEAEESEEAEESKEAK